MHQGLEETTQGASLLEGEPDKGLYTRLLKTHYWFHKEIERHTTLLLEETGVQILDWPDCERIVALEKDLLALDKIPSVEDELENQDAVAFLAGLCYVSEGSCLGNQMMHNHLKKNASFQSWGAEAFFSSCREGFGQRWRGFLRQLQQISEGHYSELEAGTVAGYRLFERLWHKS